MTAGGALAARSVESSNQPDKSEPSLLAIVEMNLEEYPAFRLGRRSKRPELRYTRTRTDAEGRSVEQVWVVRGAEGLGLPGPFEQDLYVALLVLFTEQGLPADGRIRFTRNRIAQLMEISNSGRGYELIEQGLRRLAGASVHSEHSFYRPGALVPGPRAEAAARPPQRDKRPAVQRGGPAERLSLDFHILEEVRVYERSTHLFLEDADPAQRAQRAERVDRAKPFELSVARLGQPLVQSYERRYTKALDAGFYFSLKGPLAKRLYRYVDKVRNGRGAFEIGLRALGDVLGLEYRYPSDIKDGLTEAHAELRERAYLSGVQLAPLAGGPNAGEKVVYAFNPAFDQRGKKRVSTTATSTAAPALETQDAGPASLQTSEVPPLQLALEAFGVSTKRAAALVGQFPEEHIAARLEHVRARSKDQKAAPLRNPAGYLAKAIEDSFTIKERPAEFRGRTSGEHEGPSEPASAYSLGSASGPSTRSVRGPSQDQLGGPGGAQRPPDPAAEPLPHIGPTPTGIWGQLAAHLRTKLTGATYAAFIAPALLAAPESPTDTTSLTLPLPTAFTFEKWHRPPIKDALAQATAELGITLTLQAPATT